MKTPQRRAVRGRRRGDILSLRMPGRAKEFDAHRSGCGLLSVGVVEGSKRHRLHAVTEKRRMHMKWCGSLFLFFPWAIPE